MLIRKHITTSSPEMTQDCIELKVRLSGPTLIKLVSIAMAVIFGSSVCGEF
ncbi:hypothetical protein Lepto7375DRAFT_6801 [Leptolyngbya sp. PCC 7375]|nr:hypothetical protein Lepto7375DRAFT_6801 [Leptolyngbya sp. PCC 7375]